MAKKLMRKILLGVCSLLSLVCATSSIVGLSAKADAQGQSDDYGQLLYSFQVMSDMEITGNKSHNNSTNFRKALNAVKTYSPHSVGIFMPGDVTSNGYAEEWTNWNAIIDEVGGLPNIYPTVGNHDLTPGTPKPYDELYQNYLAATGMGNTYFDNWINGTHFIALGSEDTGHNVPIYSEEQFTWFEEKLAENASYDKPIFVFSHYALRNTTAGTFLGSEIGHSVGSEDKLRFMEILKDYPQVIWFTAHTHFAVNSPNNHYNIDLENGNGADLINDGSLSYQCIGDYSANTGSQFLFVDVYENAVKVQGYDVHNGRFMEDAVTVIDTKSKTPTIQADPKIELSADTINATAQEGVKAYITFENEPRVSAADGAWVGIVGSNKEGIVGDILRYAMLKDLPKDENGRYVWDMKDDNSCSDVVRADWQELMARYSELYIGLFEDTLYVGYQPSAPTFSAYQYDPYARLAKAVVKIEGGIEMLGKGTKAEPYLISDKYAFAVFSDTIRYKKANYKGKYFKQTADIDMSGIKLYVNDEADANFAGIYDGNGYVLKNINFTSTNGYAQFNSVFGVVTGKILNLGVVDSSFNGTYVGSIVRKLMDGGCLLNCYSSAEVLGSGRGTGLCDYMTGDMPKFVNCVFTGTASGTALIGSTYQAVEPLHDMLYYSTRSASSAGVADGVNAMDPVDMGTTSFIKKLNENREQAAKMCGISLDYLCKWEIKDGKPVLKPASSNAYQTYNITYVLNGGINDESNPSTYAKGASVKLADATKEGYQFVGWFNAAVGGKQITTISKTSTGDIKLYAIFEAIPVVSNIVYELDGGVNSENNPATYQEGVGLVLENATKDGYTFVGWYDAAEGGNKITEISTTTTGTITLYARFESVSADDGGNSGCNSNIELGAFAFMLCMIPFVALKKKKAE